MSAGPYWPPATGRTYQEVVLSLSGTVPSVAGSSATDAPDANAFGAVEDSRGSRLPTGRSRAEGASVRESVRSFSEFGASVASGMRIFTPHSGQMPIFPAKKDLTLSRWPLGQWNRMPIFAIKPKGLSWSRYALSGQPTKYRLSLYRIALQRCKLSPVGLPAAAYRSLKIGRETVIPSRGNISGA